MSVAEVMILLIVGIVVVGPKRLPEMMRKAGKWVTKLRRLSTDLRAQSGIDRILREEGLEKEIRELRALRESLSKHALFDSLVSAANKPASSASSRTASGGGPAKALPASSAASKAELKPAEGANALPAADTSTPAGIAALADASATAGPTSTETAEPSPAVLATGSDGSQTTSTASSLIRRPEGAVARTAVGSYALNKPTANREPFRSFREREYPSYGPDHYEAFPDDLEPSEDDLPADLAPITPPLESPVPREVPSAKESAP